LTKLLLAKLKRLLQCKELLLFLWGAVEVANLKLFDGFCVAACPVR
jgi:hypothetical protein